MTENGQATVRSVAAQARVSIATVTRALRNDPHVAEATRRKVRRAARQLNYAANPLASNVMSHIRRARVSWCRGKLAWLNSDADSEAWTKISWLRPVLDGVRKRAEQAGFLLENFWLADPVLKKDRVHNILKARGVQGLIIPDPYICCRLDPRFDVRGVACVTLSTPPPELPVHEVSLDYADAVRQAFAALRERGYARIGLMLHVSQDLSTQGASRARYLLETAGLPANDRIPPLMLPEDMTQQCEGRILWARWFDRYEPDAVVCADEHVLDWVTNMGLRVPADLGLVHIDRHVYLRQWAGIQPPEDQIGTAAVDLVVGQLIRGEFGLPPFQKRMLIKGRWVDGGTVRPAASM